MRLDGVLDQGQPKAAAFYLRHVGFGHAVKFPEYLFLFGGRNAVTVVDHFNDNSFRFSRE